MTIATVTSKGQVTIPADIRADFGIRAGDQIVFYRKIGGGLGVHVKRPRRSSGRGILSESDRRVAAEDMGPGRRDGAYDPGGLGKRVDDEELPT